LWRAAGEDCAQKCSIAYIALKALAGRPGSGFVCMYACPCRPLLCVDTGLQACRCSGSCHHSRPAERSSGAHIGDGTEVLLEVNVSEVLQRDFH